MCNFEYLSIGIYFSSWWTQAQEEEGEGEFETQREKKIESVL